jgi:two-component system, NtrC family, response regulator AtoC
MERKKKILLVDDEEDLCFLLKRILARGNKYEIHTASEIPAAVKKIKEEDFALVLSDYTLPGDGDGLDILFKAKEKNPNVITILMTAYGTDQLAIRAVAEGVYDYLLKPFKSVLEVQNVVERGLRYFDLVDKYNREVSDTASQKEMLKEVLVRARRTRKILRELGPRINT